MLCAAIVGLVAAIAAPRYAASLARLRLESATQRLRSDIDLARQQARATSAPVTLWFRVNLNAVKILEMPRLDDPGSVYRTALGEDPYRCTLTAADFGGDDLLVFDGYGRPDSGGTLRIVHGGAGRTLTVAANGKVSVSWD